MVPSSSGVVYEFARAMKLGANVAVMGVLPPRFGERTGEVVAQFIVQAEHFDEGDLAAVEHHCATHFGTQKARLQLVG